MHAASNDNNPFLHARFSLVDDLLRPRKYMIIYRISPPDYRGPISVSKARKAISDYKKALGQPESLAGLTVFY